MNCEYPDCPDQAAFDCECHGEGLREQKHLCDEHKKRAEFVCTVFGWELTVKIIPLVS